MQKKWLKAVAAVVLAAATAAATQTAFKKIQLEKLHKDMNVIWNLFNLKRKLKFKFSKYESPMRHDKVYSSDRFVS